MDMPFRDKLIKQASWSSKEGVWEWPELRDLGRSTFDTWERVIADNKMIGQNHERSRGSNDKANLIHKENEY
jgi:hypothetical protein